MKKPKLRYQKPKIRSKQVKVNYFFDPRLLDSFDAVGSLWNRKVFAQSSSSGGSTSVCSCNTCFLQGTRITLADRLTKDIKDIRPGDRILSFDISGNITTTSVVTGIENHVREDGYYVLNNSLRVTHDHPLLVNNNEWKRVENVNAGDTLLTFDGKLLPITKIYYIRKKVKVYNFQVEGLYKNYFAGGILAKNYSFFYKDETTEADAEILSPRFAYSFL